MYPQAEEFIKYIKICFPYYFNEINVLDIGTLLNGNQQHFTECQYYITDITLEDETLEDKTRKRDLLSAKDLEFNDEYFDTILCTECLEYDPRWSESIININRMLKNDGLFLMIFDSLENENAMTIEGLNRIINFNETFRYWDCYIDKNRMEYFFIGIKKSIIENEDISIVKYDNNISKLRNANIENITSKIL